MKKVKEYNNNLLHISVVENRDSITLFWKGKSIDRQPGKFITPILVETIKKSSEEQKRIIIDFRQLDYMNSSSITPLIKILERAKRGTTPVNVYYKKSLRWQTLSFSALEIFKTKDQRVDIKGM